jgi:hypothetical protein
VSRARIRLLAVGTLLALTTLSSCAPAHAEGLTIGAHLGSWHSQPGFNNANPGLFVRAKSGLTAGVYRNSIRRTSTYVGYTASWAITPRVDASVTVGAITGYTVAPVMPMVVPSLRVGLTEQLSARVIYIPRVHEKQGADVLHLALEWSL